MSRISDTRIADIARLAAGHRSLRMLVLFGSRARGEMRATSDWDLGYLADPAFDPLALLGELSHALATDRIDLVDLGRAGAQLRFRVAAESHPVYFSDPNVFIRFWTDAVEFWCDAAPLIEAGYREVLAGLRG
jgi:predicted nucleotidyltransferase